MTARHVSFTFTARAQIDQHHWWWLEHRDQRQVFELELAAALDLLALLPGVGTPYGAVPGTRRLYLDKLDSHLYYTYDDERGIIRSSGVPGGPRAVPQFLSFRLSSDPA